MARLDFAFVRLRIALECDGREEHSLPEPLFHDRFRAEDITNLGWRILRVTATDLRRPDQLVARIRRMMALAA